MGSKIYTVNPEVHLPKTHAVVNRQKGGKLILCKAEKNGQFEPIDYPMLLKQLKKKPESLDKLKNKMKLYDLRFWGSGFRPNPKDVKLSRNGQDIIAELPERPKFKPRERWSPKLTQYVKDEFMSLSSDFICFNTAWGFLCKPAVQAMNDYNKLSATLGASEAARLFGNVIQENANRAVAKLVGCDHPDEVFFGNSGSQMVQTLISSFRLQSEYIGVDSLIFPSIVAAFKAQTPYLGFSEKNVVRLPTDDYGNVFPEALSQWDRKYNFSYFVLTGMSTLGRIPRIREAVEAAKQKPVFLDAVQLPGRKYSNIMKETGCSAAFGSARKLGGPQWLGWACIKREMHDKLAIPRTLDIYGSKVSYDEEKEEFYCEVASDHHPMDQFRSFERSCAALEGLTAAVEFLLRIVKIDRAIARIEALGQKFFDEAKKIPEIRFWSGEGGIFAFEVQGFSAKEIERRLREEHGIIVDSFITENGKKMLPAHKLLPKSLVRVSIHWTNTEAEVDTLLNALKSSIHDKVSV